MPQMVADFFAGTQPSAVFDPNGLVVSIGKDREIFIPSELLEVLPGQPFLKQTMSLKQKDAMIKFACRPPPENRDLIMQDRKSVV